MSNNRASRIGWKKELAALVLGLLLGSAWEAAHAEARAVSPGTNGPTVPTTPAPGS